MTLGGKLMDSYISKEQVHNRGCDAVGKTIGELMKEMDQKASGNKAKVGYAWESWFGVESNSDAQPDLPAANIELKATGVKETKNGPSAKERLVLNIINYVEEYDKFFETSSFWKKNRYLELGFYEYIKDVDWKEWKILKSVLFTYPIKDLLIIKNDWEKIHTYIKTGKAHELSEGLTMYLGACTKGANRDSLRMQHPSLNAPKAKQRAYSLKSGYMTYLLRDYVFGESEDINIRINPFELNEAFEPFETDYSDECIVKDIKVLENSSLENYILNKLNRYRGKSITELAKLFQIYPNKLGLYPKAINAMLASRMLDIYGDLGKTEEFFKANVQVKTIRISNKNKIRENMSFPAFKFKELVIESWEDSYLRGLLDSTKFFFVVFKEDSKGDYYFQGGKFWSMPEHQIETIVKEVWQDTREKIRKGVHLKFSNNQVSNNFIKTSDKRIIHVRPHARKASYEKSNPNADELPTNAYWKNKPDNYSDNWMTKQSFWLNNDYVLEQLEDLL